MTTTIHSLPPHTEPGLTDQPNGLRDCAVRDPSGSLVRVQATA